MLQTCRCTAALPQPAGPRWGARGAKLNASRVSRLPQLAAVGGGASSSPVTSASQDARALVGDLLAAIEPTQRGLATPAAALQRIETAISRLEQAPSCGSLSANWRLLWTTEKETLWILKNAGLFGTKAGDVYQIIDVEAALLQNVITFPPEGAFVVDSGIELAGERRVNFKFSAATLQLPAGRDVRLPPFGQGWFDNVYMDDSIRVSKDIRGDILITARDGAAQRFQRLQQT